MVTMISRRQTLCKFPGCTDKATDIACGRLGKDVPRKVYCLCAYHARILVEGDEPEYRVVCPNCKCKFGVG